MFKKISGVDESSCRERMIAAKQEMLNYIKILKGKKLEHGEMIKAFDIEREEMSWQKKLASMFKFNKMEKKKYFMPSYDVKGEFEDSYIKSNDHALPYIEGRIR